MSERCPTCDREACDRDEAQIVRVVCNCPTIWCEHWKRLADARAACDANAVNWRERALAAEALEAWVPVGERLPEVGARVLAVVKPPLHEFWIASLNADVRWCGSGGVGLGDLVTHWMDLPAPQRGSRWKR